MLFELTILGCNSAIPAHGRFPTAQVLTVHSQNYLIDCGEGTQMRLQENGISKQKISTVFISHLHGDHIFGLVGLINSMSLGGRTEALNVYSPTGLEEIVSVHFKYMKGDVSFPLTFHEVDCENSVCIFEDKLVCVYSVPLNHRIPTCGYLFREKEDAQLLNIIPEKIIEYRIPVNAIREIKTGKDLVLPSGEVIPNKELTLPPFVPRSYAFCSDTRYEEKIVPIIEGVDLLYHESTFLDSEKELAIKTMHSTALEAATIARKAGVGRLIIGHYSSRYKNVNVFLEEAKTVFPETALGLERATFSVHRKRKV